MRINFKLCDLYDILDNYESIFLDLDKPWIDGGDKGDELYLNGYRIVIPELKISVREGDLFFDDDNPSNDEPVYAGSVSVIYDENETDATKFKSYATAGIGTILSSNFGKYRLTYDEANGLDCYIETDEFLTEAETRKMFPKGWEDDAMDQYKELFEVIKNVKHYLFKTEDGIMVSVSDSFGRSLHIEINKEEIWLEDNHYFLDDKSKEGFLSTYKKIIDLTKCIINGELAKITICNSSADWKFMSFFAPNEEVQPLNEENEILNFIREKGHDVIVGSRREYLLIDLEFWGQKRRRYDICISDY